MVAGGLWLTPVGGLRRHDQPRFEVYPRNRAEKYRSTPHDIRPLSSILNPARSTALSVSRLG